MNDFFNKPYDLLESKTFRCLFVFGNLGFVLIFLTLFKPYGLYNLKFNEKFLIIGLDMGTAMTLMILQFFLLQNYVIKNYTVQNTIIWIALSLFLVGTSGFVVNFFLYREYNFQRFLFFQGVALSIEVIPISLFILIHYNLTLTKRLKITSLVNNALNNRNKKPDNNLQVIINSENKKEGLRLFIDSLLYITSVDNYIDVYYSENDKIDHKILRYSLSGVEQDNRNLQDIFRCHKSYIVNKRTIESISGNAAGYKIKLNNVAELIPVSRRWNGQIQTLLSAK